MRGRDRHRQQQPDKSEQIAEGEHRENDPDRMQPDALTDQLGRDDIAFDELPDQEDRRPRQRSASSQARTARAPRCGRHQEPGQRADIGHEGDQAGHESDQQCEMQADER